MADMAGKVANCRCKDPPAWLLCIAGISTCHADQTEGCNKRPYGLTEQFRAAHGDKLVARLQAQHIRGLIDAKAPTPAAPNRLRFILRPLLLRVVSVNMAPTLPYSEMRYQVKGFEIRSEDVIAAFEARWSVGTRARLAMALLLYTEQRPVDVIRIGRQHLRGVVIAATQRNTGERLSIPLILSWRLLSQHTRANT